MPIRILGRFPWREAVFTAAVNAGEQFR